MTAVPIKNIVGALVEKKPLKVMQTKFGKDRGNCLTACVACLTGVPIEQIPDLYSHSGIEWWDSLYDWCVQNDYTLIYFKEKNIPVLILNGYGIGAFTVEGSDERHAVILEYKLANRGNVKLGEEWNHDAFVYHDPNPLKPKLKDLEFHIFIIPNAIQGEVQITLSRERLIVLLTIHIGWDEIGIANLSDAILKELPTLLETVKPNKGEI